ncbi:hypothetical protein EDB83DRAFT_2527959 [Lactarius deliciosus]|nr:hypothetical protein EDB83DRAFT_2527959 [Lactarius deliciosus]
MSGSMNTSTTTTDAESPLPSLARALSDAHGGSSTTHSHSASKLPRTRTPGTYDGRETDAWALGVVLFTLATRALPFHPLARRRWVLRVVGPGRLPYPTERRKLSFTQVSEDLAPHIISSTYDLARHLSEHGDDIHSLRSANELNTEHARGRLID